MKTGFKDRLQVKKKEHGDRPWSFKAPDYDKRTSCFVSAGDDYGVGVNQPVGTEKVSGSYAVPVGRIKTLDLYEKK